MKRIRRYLWRSSLSTHPPSGANTPEDISPTSANVVDFDPKEMLALIEQQLDEDKAEKVVTIDLKGKSELADAMVVASGRSQRHVGAMADKIARALKEAGMGTASIEGVPACDWVLVDAKDVIVHLFRPEVREFYNLERIWAPDALAKADAN